ncbi:MAG: DUF2029 domain-containing protein [Cyclobacteriaceae bacterium]|nr:DUF2029 domain-containing protein [Cyclobacteriaceae bacterium]MDX5465784.1 DUF2029 domain-containing protein [Cyclobacteriaceae bacterium]
MNHIFQKILIFLFSGLMFLGCYFLLATPRIEFWTIFLLYSGLFLGMIALYYAFRMRFSLWIIFLIGLGMRLSSGFLFPNLSEDYARFLWDGKLILKGENPYRETPRAWLENPQNKPSADMEDLLEKLNSPDYFSVYPPLNQAIFGIAAKIGGESLMGGILALRVLLLLGELGVFFLFLRLLRLFDSSKNQLIWYWLNPFVVMEIVGNLHFEGMILGFLLVSVLAIRKRQFGISGGFWGLAVGLKLLPLILGPGFFFFQQIKKNRIFWLVFALVMGLSFFPLILGESYGKFLESLSLYSGKFEFNASVYYLLREIGFWIQGYNMIGDLTKVLSSLTLVLVFYFSWKKRQEKVTDLLELMVVTYLTYLILQPVVHPWYILPGLGLSVLAKKKTFIFWSFGAVFSYQAYGNPENWENPLWLMLEYGMVLLGIYLDYFQPKRNPNFETKN